MSRAGDRCATCDGSRHDHAMGYIASHAFTIRVRAAGELAPLPSSGDDAGVDADEAEQDLIDELRCDDDHPDWQRLVVDVIGRALTAGRVQGREEERKACESKRCPACDHLTSAHRGSGCERSLRPGMNRQMTWCQCELLPEAIADAIAARRGGK